MRSDVCDGLGTYLRARARVRPRDWNRHSRRGYYNLIRKCRHTASQLGTIAQNQTPARTHAQTDTTHTHTATFTHASNTQEPSEGAATHLSLSASTAASALGHGTMSVRCVENRSSTIRLIASRNTPPQSTPLSPDTTHTHTDKHMCARCHTCAVRYNSPTYLTPNRRSLPSGRARRKSVGRLCSCWKACQESAHQITSLQVKPQYYSDRIKHQSCLRAAVPACLHE